MSSSSGPRQRRYHSAHLLTAPPTFGGWGHTLLKLAAMLFGGGPITRKRRAEALQAARPSGPGAADEPGRRAHDDGELSTSLGDSSKPSRRQCVALRGPGSTPGSSPKGPSGSDSLQNETPAPSVDGSEDDGPEGSAAGEGEAPMCWICLDGGAGDSALRPVCGCTGLVAHPRCLAKWQLHKAGTREERHCRFCDQDLPDWREQVVGAPSDGAPPVMTVTAGGRPVTLRPRGGPGGVERFRAELLSALELQPDTEIQLVFECVEPFTGTRMTLKGAGTFDAAMYCAAIAAAKRQLQAEANAAGHV